MVGLELTYASSSTAGLTPMFTEKIMSKVRPSLQCVMGLSMQYFIIHAVLTLARTTNQLTNNFRVGVQNTLETACAAPMILQTLFDHHYSLLRAVKVQTGCLRRRRRLRDGVLDGCNCLHSDLIPCAPGALYGLHRSDRLCRPHLLPGRRFENAADFSRHAIRHNLTLQHFSGVAI